MHVNSTTSTSGHYVTLSRSGASDVRWLYDDERVCLTGRAQAQNNAYLLFYASAAALCNRENAVEAQRDRILACRRARAADAGRRAAEAAARQRAAQEDAAARRAREQERLRGEAAASSARAASSINTRSQTAGLRAPPSYRDTNIYDYLPNDTTGDPRSRRRLCRERDEADSDSSHLRWGDVSNLRVGSPVVYRLSSNADADTRTAHIVAIDSAAPSYTIQLDGDGAERSTDADRIRPHHLGKEKAIPTRTHLSADAAVGWLAALARTRWAAAAHLALRLPLAPAGCSGTLPRSQLARGAGAGRSSTHA